MPKVKFFDKGLRFSCSECGQCCSFPGGYVTLSIEEAERIAAYVGISEDLFMEEYLILHKPDKYELRFRDNGNCFFLKDNRCSIYPVRPVQCRTFPFWPENLKSAYRWKIMARDCPGINQGRLYSAKEIEEILDENNNPE